MNDDIMTCTFFALRIICVAYSAGSKEIPAKDIELYQSVHIVDHVWMLVAKATGIKKAVTLQRIS